MQVFAHSLTTGPRKYNKNQKSQPQRTRSTTKEDQFRFSFVTVESLVVPLFDAGPDLNSSVSLQLKTTRIRLAPCAAFLVLRSFLCFSFRMPRPRPSPTSSASGNGFP